MTQPSADPMVEFVLARVAEYEAAARAASPGGWHYGDVDSVAGGTLYDKSRTIASLIYEQPGDHDGSIVRHLLEPEADANGAHIARHDPARVLAECEAKRRIVENHLRHSPGERGYGASRYAVAALARAHSDHPDYQARWTS